MTLYTFEPKTFTFNTSKVIPKTYESFQMKITIGDNTDYTTYKTWLNGDAVQYIDASNLKKLTSSDLTAMAAKFQTYSPLSIEVEV
jgi:hypothetical protein